MHGLTKGNFRIYDEGIEREIAAFSEETVAQGSLASTGPASAPANAVSAAATEPLRFLALWIDDVNAKDLAAANDLPRTKTAARRFIAESLHPGTRLGIFTASGTVTQDFTTDTAKCEEAIAKHQTPPANLRDGAHLLP